MHYFGQLLAVVMNCLVIKFKQRSSNDISNKYLAEIYVKGSKFDIDLISTDQKVFAAHKFVVIMFSDYLKEYIREFKPKGKACGECDYLVSKFVVCVFFVNVKNGSQTTQYKREIKLLFSEKNC